MNRVQAGQAAAMWARRAEHDQSRHCVHSGAADLGVSIPALGAAGREGHCPGVKKRTVVLEWELVARALVAGRVPRGDWRVHISEVGLACVAVHARWQIVVGVALGARA